MVLNTCVFVFAHFQDFGDVIYQIQSTILNITKHGIIMCTVHGFKYFGYSILKSIIAILIPFQYNDVANL